MLRCNTTLCTLALTKPSWSTRSPPGVIGAPSGTTAEGFTGINPTSSGRLGSTLRRKNIERLPMKSAFVFDTIAPNPRSITSEVPSTSWPVEM